MPKGGGGKGKGGGGRGGGGGGKGVPIGGVYASAEFDASAFEEGLDALDAAGRIAAQRQAAYTQAIERGWTEASAQGRAATANFLEVAAAAMRAGASFETAGKAVSLAGGGRAAADALRAIKAEVEGLTAAEERNLKVTADFGKAIQARTGRVAGGAGEQFTTQPAAGSVEFDSRMGGTGRYVRYDAAGKRKIISTREGEMATGRATTAASAEAAAGGLEADLETKIKKRELTRVASRDITKRVRAALEGPPEDPFTRVARSVSGRRERKAIETDIEERYPEDDEAVEARLRVSERERLRRRTITARVRAALEPPGDRTRERETGFRERTRRGLVERDARREIEREYRGETEEAKPARDTEADFEAKVRKSELEKRARKDIQGRVRTELGEPESGRERRGGIRGFVDEHSTGIRIAAGLAGIPLGINIIAGAARNLHAVIDAMAQTFEHWHTSVHQLGVEFGQTARQQQQFAEGMARQQSFDPAVINETITGVSRLTQAYQLTGVQIQTITDQTATLARINNQPAAQLPQLGQRLTQALSQGGAVPELGIDLSQQYLERVRKINLSAMTPEQQFDAREKDLQRQLEEQKKRQAQAGQTPGQGTAEYEAERRRNTAVTNAGRGAGGIFSGLGTWVAERIADVGESQQPAVDANARRTQAMQNLGITDFQGALFARGGQTLDAQTAAQAEADIRTEITRLTNEENDAAKANEKAHQDVIDVLHKEASALEVQRGARSRLIQDLQVGLVPGRQAGQLAQLGRGAEFASASPTARRFVAGLQAEEAVGVEQAAVRARRSPAIDVRTGLVAELNNAQAAYKGIEAAQQRGSDLAQNEADRLQRSLELARQRVDAAQHLVDLYDRQLMAARQLIQVDQAQTFISIARGNAQSGITALELQQRHRLFDIDKSGIAPADAMAQARIKVLQAQKEMAPLQLRQLDYQRNVTLANREHLENQRNLLQTQLDSLAATERMQDIEYGLSHNRAEAAAITARMLSGEQVDPHRFVELMQSQRQLTLEQAKAGPAALEAQRAVQLAQRPVERETLQRQLSLNALQEQGRALEDAMYVQERKQQAAQHEADEIQRQLDIAKAMDQPTQTLYERAITMADEWKLVADNAQRFAQFIQAGGKPGEDPLDKAKQQLAGAALMGINPGERGQAPSLPLYLARGRDFYPSAAAAAAAMQNGGTFMPPGAARGAVPIVAASPPGVGGVQVSVSFPNAVINNMDDIEKAAQAAAGKAYEQTKSAMVQAMNGASNNVNPSLAGAGR